MLEIEELWGTEAKSCIGHEIIDIELVTICQMIRLKFKNKQTIELAGAWRYKSEKSILIGSMDIGFMIETPESEGELDEFIEEQTKIHFKKLKSIVGKKLLSVNFESREVFFSFTGTRYIDWFCLSADEVGFRVIETRDSMHA